MKNIYTALGDDLINPWLITNNRSIEEALCWINKGRSDFQNQNHVALYGKLCDHACKITKSNLIQGLVYVAVRLCIPATWLNDRDQFTAPRKAKYDNTKIEDTTEFEFETDEEFVNNCVVYSLFAKNNTNWQIFPNSQIALHGVERDMKMYNLLLKNKVFSPEAEAVLEASRAIYKLHNGEFNNPNASWYDVNKALRESRNITYDNLRKEFLHVISELAMEIADGVYKYGFLS